LESGSVTFEYHKNTVQIIGLIVSVISVLLTITLVILKLVGKNFVQGIKQKISLLFSNRFQDIKKRWEDEEN
jgi:hypothetical protein